MAPGWAEGKEGKGKASNLFVVERVVGRKKGRKEGVKEGSKE